MTEKEAVIVVVRKKNLELSALAATCPRNSNLGNSNAGHLEAALDLQ